MNEAMDRGRLLDRVAPCGLVCFTCLSYAQGVIYELCGKLLYYLDGHEQMLAQNQHPDLPAVHTTMRALAYWHGQDCHGCRHENHKCQNSGCVIRSCTRERGHDFCAQCAEFPCGMVRENPAFMAHWKTANTRIREVGAEAFFIQEKDKPHYRRFREQE